jgi:hypothetical protein
MLNAYIFIHSFIVICFHHCESSRTKKRILLDNITLTLTIISHTRPASFTEILFSFSISWIVITIVLWFFFISSNIYVMHSMLYVLSVFCLCMFLSFCRYLTWSKSSIKLLKIWNFILDRLSSFVFPELW